MEYLQTLKDTPLPTLLVLLGAIFLLLGIATIKKPIVILVSTTGRKISGIVGSLIFIFGVVLYLLPNNVISPANPTAAPVPSSTITETLPNPAVAIQPGLTNPPAITPSLTLSATQTPLFADDFSGNFLYWDLPSKDAWSSIVNAKIGGGKLKLIINCPPSKNVGCRPSVTLRDHEVKDFYVSFDLIFENQTPSNANTRVNFLFRLYDLTNYYAFSINTLGDYYFDYFNTNQGQNPLIDEPKSLPIAPILGEPVNIRITANDTKLSIYENNTQIESITDGQDLNSGGFQIGYSVSPNVTATISIENFTIYGLDH